MKKIIVIGSGIGGLSVAARLLHLGFQVEIFEKNPYVGGKTGQITHGDFCFDLTSSIMMFPNNYTDIFYFCNKNYKEYFSLIPISKLYSVFYYDNSKYDFYTSLPKLNNTLSQISKKYPDDISGYFDFLSRNNKKYLFSEKMILNKSFLNTWDMLKPISFFKSSDFNPLTTCYKEAKKYIDNEKLLDYILFQSMYIGISPYTSPSIYNIIPAATELYGLYHVKGGMFSYIQALKKLVFDLGGIIHTNSKVNRILFKHNKAIGVMVNGQNHYSSSVVCSSDYSYSANSLIKDQEIRTLLPDIKNLDYSCSTFILYLGLDKKYPSLNIHNIYINKDFRFNIEAPFKGFLPSAPSLYIYCPTSIDSTMCPNGCEAINVMVRVPNMIHSSLKWSEETIYYYTKKVLNTLSSIKGLEDILSHIVYINHLTPVDLRNNYNTYGGCAFGLSHNLNQSVIFRPQCVLPKIKNLYFTGSSVHPGNGAAMVLKSSKICATKIYKSYWRYIH